MHTIVYLKYSKVDPWPIGQKHTCNITAADWSCVCKGMRVSEVMMVGLHACSDVSYCAVISMKLLLSKCCTILLLSTFVVHNYKKTKQDYNRDKYFFLC